MAAGLVLASLVVLAACSTVKEQKHVIAEPVNVEKVMSGPAHVTLVPSAYERLGIETVAVEERGGQRAVSAGAILVDAKGSRWVYVAEQPLVFVRYAVNVEREDAGVAYLTEGPAIGTRVVTVGAAELYGAETGIGK